MWGCADTAGRPKVVSSGSSVEGAQFLAALDSCGWRCASGIHLEMRCRKQLWTTQIRSLKVMQSAEQAQERMSESGSNRLSAGIDVAIPCYQYGRFLRDGVTSVLSQGIRSVRVLIIDNASTDNSVEVAQQLAAEDRRVEVVAHRRNLGQHASFNEGIDWARADYFLILCADDLLAPGALARAISLMERQPKVHLTYGRALIVPMDEPFPSVVPMGGKENGACCGGVICWNVSIAQAGTTFLDPLPSLGPACRSRSATTVRSCRIRMTSSSGCVSPGLAMRPKRMRFKRSNAVTRSISAPQLQTSMNGTCIMRPPLRAFSHTNERIFPMQNGCAGLLEGASPSELTDAPFRFLPRPGRHQPGPPEVRFQTLSDHRDPAPVTYLFRREDTIRRIVSVASEVIAWPRPSAKAARIGG